MDIDWAGSVPEYNIHTNFQSIYIYKMDKNQRIDSGQRYAKRRPKELTKI